MLIFVHNQFSLRFPFMVSFAFLSLWHSHSHSHSLTLAVYLIILCHAKDSQPIELTEKLSQTFREAESKEIRMIFVANESISSVHVIQLQSHVGEIELLSLPFIHSFIHSFILSLSLSVSFSLSLALSLSLSAV
jgi:hypothetical protein